MMENPLVRTECDVDTDIDVRDYIVQESNYQHAAMVSRITETLARNYGLGEEEAREAGKAALLHDIGKNFIPQEILNKPGRLTTDEYSIVKTHAELGFEYLVSQIKVLFLSAILALQHHERIDGSGYAGMTREEIHPLAKLVAVADVFDALYSQRPYKEPWSTIRVKDNLMEGRGKLFEPEYVDLILASLDEILGLYREYAPKEELEIEYYE